MAQEFRGRYSPGAKATPTAEAPPPAGPNPFRNRRARNVNIFARLLYAAPVPLLFAAFGSIGRGAAPEALVELLGFAALMLAAWLLNEGLRAEEAYDDRKIARPPAIPRKLLAAILSGLGVFVVSWLAAERGLFGGLIFGGLASAAHLIGFGLDPMKRKGLEGFDEFETDRAARAIEKAEAVVAEMTSAAARIGDRSLKARVEALADSAREVFRTVEQDPRDLSRARKFLTVYLAGARDATVKFADLYSRSRDPEVRQGYEALLTDLEASFTKHRTDLLEDNRSDLDVEIEVLRERLQREGLKA